MKSYELPLSIVQKWLQLLPLGSLLLHGHQADQVGLVHRVGQAGAVDQAGLAVELRLGE
jgi:hypothetical protein